MKAIILAGGKGTRFGKLTQKTPKALIKISGKPILEYTLSSLPSAIDEVHLVIGHLGEKIKKHIGNDYKGLKINYIKLKELTGTATALLEARSHVLRGKFLVLYGDDIYSKRELEKLIKNDWAIGLAKHKPQHNKFLNFTLNPKKKITGTRYSTGKEMREGALIATGAFILDVRIFRYKPAKLSNGEYGLPQTMLKSINTRPIKGVIMRNWIQINRPEDIKRAEKILNKK